MPDDDLEMAEHLLELLAVVLAVVILLVEHDLDAREGGVARLGEGGVSVVTLAVEMTLGVEHHRVDGVDREMDVGLGEAIHKSSQLHEDRREFPGGCPCRHEGIRPRNQLVRQQNRNSDARTVREFRKNSSTTVADPSIAVRAIDRHALRIAIRRVCLRVTAELREFGPGDVTRRRSCPRVTVELLPRAGR